MSMEKIIYLVDDEAELRKALNRLLSSEGFAVIEFESGDAFLRSMPANGSGCVLLDIAMPGIDGLETQRRLTELGCVLPIIFLTAQGGIPESVRAVKAGAVDFLAKPVKSDDLLRAVASAFEQLDRQRGEVAQRGVLLERLNRLTPREREVFEHVIAGRKNKVIADRMGVTEQTVKVHRGRVVEKLEVRSLAEMVRLAELLGITPSV